MRAAAPASEDTGVAALVPALSAYIAAALLLFSGYHIRQEIDVAVYPIADWIATATMGAGLALCFYASLAGVSLRRRENAAVAGLVIAFVAYAATFVLYRFSSYGSDALLFSVYSAQLAAGGTNPYAHSMAEAFSQFGVSKALVTPTASGGEILAQSYPALSFLLYLPFLMAGVNALWVDIAAHVLLLLVLVWVAPRPIKALAPLVLFADHSYLDYTLGSITDIVWVLPVALCARFWNSKPWLAALFLGLACALKQPPWFVAPFAFVARAIDSGQSRDPRRLWVPLSVFAAAFLAPNVPFIAAGPTEWASGILTPIQGELIAFGSGFLQLATANLIVVDRGTLALVSPAVLGVMIVAYCFYSKRLAFLPFLAPAFALFFASRELQNYYMYWPIPLMVFALSPKAADVAEAEPSERKQQWSAAPLTIAAMTVLFVGALVVRGSTAQKPMAVAIAHAGYDAATGNLNAFDVRVSNTDPDRRAVRLGVFLQGRGDDFYYWLREPVEVPGGSTRVVHLVAPTVHDELKPGPLTVQVVAVDAKSGNQTYSEPRELQPYLAGITNPLLADWQTGPPRIPAGWTYVASDNATNYAFKAMSGGRPVLALSVPPPLPSDDDVRFVSVGQSIKGAATPFAVLLLPDQDDRGGARPTTFFGIQLTDAVGHTAYLGIDSSLRSMTVAHQGNATAFVYPGRLHAWNTIDIDPHLLASAAHFVWAEGERSQIAVEAIAHRGDPAPAGGQFGGLVRR